MPPVNLTKPATTYPEPPERVSGIAKDGHLWNYRVIRPTFPGGAATLGQWDAVHSPMCGCLGNA
jgi:hypothetical protein